MSIGVRQNILKGNVGNRFFKQGEPSNPTVEDVIGEVSSSETWTARHGEFSTECEASLSRKDSRSLCFPSQQTTTLWDGRLASEDCSSVRIGIDDAEAGEAEEAARKVACPLFCSVPFSVPSR